jgi:hypothetical protein
VPWTAWTGSYTGQLLFRLTWNGQSCAMATPPVATQVLKLMANGHPVSGNTDSGQKLDGSDPRPCRAVTEGTPQYAQDLPFGPSTLIVTGKDGGGNPHFQRSVDTFIGAGLYNPTMTFDVGTPPADAGVDGP